MNASKWIMAFPIAVIVAASEAAVPTAYVQEVENEPVWVDLITGWVYEIPQENQIVHADGITVVRIPAYDPPCAASEPHREFLSPDLLRACLGE